MFCQHCGAEINENAVVCVKCGCAVSGTGKVSTPASSDKATALILCFFFGWLGVHRFYLKDNSIAVVQLVLGLISCGLITGIWALIDFILILCGTFKTSDGRTLN